MFSYKSISFAFCLCVKTSLRGNHSYENEFRIRVLFHANLTYFS